VLKGIDDAIAEMDEMDTRITGYKMQLGVRPASISVETIGASY